MNKLSLNINKNDLLILMKDYYELTKIKIAIFDVEGNKLLTYPNSDCEFCKLMKSKKLTKEKCKESDRKSFKQAKDTKELVIYNCHAGLIEASFPLLSNDNVIGYIMFGQITNISSKDDLKKHINNVLKLYKTNIKDKELTYKIKYRSNSQIKAASKLLEACTFYCLYKDYVTVVGESFVDKINTYIDLHIDKEINIEDLCNYFNISRSSLYEEFKDFNFNGIAKYIRNRRIEKAKILLKESNYKINEISEKVGFIDYNYFCRVFKSIVGIPAKKYKKLHTK